MPSLSLLPALVSLKRRFLLRNAYASFFMLVVLQRRGCIEQLGCRVSLVDVFRTSSLKEKHSPGRQNSVSSCSLEGLLLTCKASILGTASLHEKGWPLATHNSHYSPLATVQKHRDALHQHGCIPHARGAAAPALRCGAWLDDLATAGDLSCGLWAIWQASFAP